MSLIVRAPMVLLAAALLANSSLTGAADRPLPRTVEEELDGAALYRANCESCHGLTGRGDGPDAELFSPPPPDLGPVLKQGDIHALVHRVLEGAPALAVYLQAVQRQADRTEAIVSHLRRLGTIDWSLAQRGRFLYLSRCESCHGAFGHPRGTVPSGARAPRDLSDTAFQAAVGDRTLLGAVRHPHGGLPPDVDETTARAVVMYVRLLSPGYEAYERLCTGCHGDNGAGARLGAAGVTRPSVVFNRDYMAAHDTAYLRARVWHMLGDPKPLMPHFRGPVSEPQARAIIEFLQTQ